MATGGFSWEQTETEVAEARGRKLERQRILRILRREQKSEFLHETPERVIQRCIDAIKEAQK